MNIKLIQMEVQSSGLTFQSKRKIVCIVKNNKQTNKQINKTEVHLLFLLFQLGNRNVIFIFMFLLFFTKFSTFLNKILVEKIRHTFNKDLK